MKTVVESSLDPVHLNYATRLIPVDPVIMTRKRMSDGVGYPMAVDEDEEEEEHHHHQQQNREMDNGKNKLPKFEYVTQISAGPSTAHHQHHHQLLSYCGSEVLDFHNEKGQRIFLTESENAEFVNIMLQENLLSVQTPMMQGCVEVQTTELLELNSAELLDLDGKSAKNCAQSNNIVTFVDNSGIEGNDFEKQLVRVEIQDDPSHSSSSTTTYVRGQTINICSANNNQPRREQQQGNAEDLEDKNLSWLFNFKLDELPHLSPEVSHRAAPIITAASASSSNNSKSHRNQEPKHPQSSVAESESSAIPEKIQKKPPFTYTELIEYALEDQSELTVSGIYQWISDRFPYYKSNDDRWKNSVRHNLSINPHFRKGNKAPQGAGHLWTIASRDSEANNLAWEHKKQRLELFFKMEAAANLAFESERNSQVNTEQDELLAATNSIMLPEDAVNTQELQHHQTSYGQENLITSHYFTQTDADSQQIIYDTVDASEDLCRVATEILSGVRRNVEVQILHPNVIGFDTVIDSCYTTADYLNPIPKDEIMQESGLRSQQQCRNDIGQDFFVTEEIDPVELGINMTTSGDEVFFSDDFNHYFGLGSNNIVA